MKIDFSDIENRWSDQDLDLDLDPNLDLDLALFITHDNRVNRTFFNTLFEILKKCVKKGPIHPVIMRYKKGQIQIQIRIQIQV